MLLFCKTSWKNFPWLGISKSYSPGFDGRLRNFGAPWTQVDLSSDTFDAAQATQVENSELFADDNCSSRNCNDGTISMMPSSDIENDIASFEFGNGVSEILRDLSSSDLFVNASISSIPSSPTLP